MGLLDTFEMLNVPEQPFLSLSKYGITFSSNSIKLLHEASYVHSFLDRKNKKFAIKPCEKDSASIDLVKNEDKKNQRIVRWGNRELLNTLCSLAEADVSTGTIRINGTYHPEEDLIIYDLTDSLKTGGDKN